MHEDEKSNPLSMLAEASVSSLFVHPCVPESASVTGGKLVFPVVYLLVSIRLRRCYILLPRVEVFVPVFSRVLAVLLLVSTS